MTMGVIAIDSVKDAQKVKKEKKRREKPGGSRRIE